MSSDANPYHSPVPDSDVADRDRQPVVSRLGMVSLLLSSVPLLIVAGLFTAQLSGAPQMTWFAAISVLVSYGLTALLAVAVGIAAFCNGFSIMATVGIVMGVLEISLLSIMLFFAAILR